MNFKLLKNHIEHTHFALQQSAIKAVNSNLTLRNWLIGWYVVTYEQNGDDRAKYGDSLLKKLALSITIKGISETSLKLFRQFYLVYPQIGQSLTDQLSTFQISQSVTDQLLLPTKIINAKNKSTALAVITSSKKVKAVDEKLIKLLIQKVSFTHFTELIKIKDDLKRQYYELLAIKQTLSVRELERQINSLSFERLGLSTNKNKALENIRKSIVPTKPANAVKDFYFFEFLDALNNEFMDESDLESALLSHLEKFILELGNGFCFEARQKRILIGDEYFFIDMVFYHRILKCHVLIELKVDKFDVSHATQLKNYIKYYNKFVKTKNDNPAIGILLVTDKNKALAEFTLDGINEKMFVSKYAIELPTKRQLENFIKRELKKL
jgi:predicted nuclease of restriction endonuclease-like (RecB) superfamily